MYRKVVYLERKSSEHKRNKILMVHTQMQNYLRTLLMINDNDYYNNGSVIIRPNKKTKLHTTKFPS